MDPPLEVKRPTRVITVQPNETVLTAFPYVPHSSLLDFLKGEPRVLGAIQILLALIIAGIGAIFAFNYFTFSQRFPLVFFTGYPFWGALIFIITGYLTGLNRKRNFLGQGVMAMNVISSLAAVAGITLTIISFQYQHHYCKMPSLEGICVVGRILFNGILSILLILSIVELSISVTVASFRSKCWSKSNEIVFFLPLDVTQRNELSITEENAVIQFDIQEEPSSDGLTTNVQPVFFGGYSFFRLKVSKNPITIYHSDKRSSHNHTSLCGTYEQQKYTPPLLKHYEKDSEKSLSVILEKRPSGKTTHTEQISDEELQLAIKQLPEMQMQSSQAKAMPLKVLPPRYVKNLEALPPHDLSSQALLVQSLLSETSTSHATQSHDLTSEDMPSQGTLSQNTRSQDTQSQSILSQNTRSQDTQSQGTLPQNTQSQDTQSKEMPSQDMLSQTQVLSSQAILIQAPTSHITQSHDQISKDMPSEDTPSQNTQSKDTPSQDMLSQVQVLPSQAMLFQAPASHITQSNYLISETMQLETQTSHTLQTHNVHLEQQSLGNQLQNTQQQDQQFTHVSYQDIQSEVKLLTQDWNSKGKHQMKKAVKQHSFEHHSKGWQSSVKQSLDLPVQDQELPRKKSLDEQIKNWISPKNPPIVKQVRIMQFSDQQAEHQLTQGKQYLKQQSQNWQGEDQQGKEGKSPKQLGEHLQSKIQKYQDWQPLGQQSHDWETQEWRNKGGKAEERKYEMQRSLNLESQAWQTQELLEKQFLKQKILYKEAQTLHATPEHFLHQQLQESQYQDKNQQDLQSAGIQKDDMEINTIQTKDMKLTDIKSLCPKPSDQQSEDMKPEFHHSSCQSSVQDESSTYLYNVGSEQDVQQNTSMSSTSYKEDPALTSCYPKDQQQSEDSD
ncbi:PREDICTED: membrane-spanning 4-domains subfamily A member 14 [Miniopterus natalensis]|uniref:membrane-spanning 4-domains subfamily A member 14 n=1 Tax=Miniopterus natalensis TaxID=291302 RepID=UPI0007A717A5|nr:PREDICTED: membrane-spanning 4-domains subfamily A member 14 [Miniopterus natalensis]